VFAIPWPDIRVYVHVVVMHANIGASVLGCPRLEGVHKVCISSLEKIWVHQPQRRREMTGQRSDVRRNFTSPVIREG